MVDLVRGGGANPDEVTIIDNQDGNLEAQALHTFNEITNYTQIIANGLTDGDEILNLNLAENEKLIIHEISLSGGGDDDNTFGFIGAELDIQVGEESTTFEPSIYGRFNEEISISSLNLPTPIICKDDTVITAEALSNDKENMSSVIFYEVISE